MWTNSQMHLFSKVFDDYNKSCFFVIESWNLNESKRGVEERSERGRERKSKGERLSARAREGVRGQKQKRG